MKDLIIRKAISTDIPSLMSLDHNYSTDHVWQMAAHNDDHEVGVTFREIRLPRPVRAEYPRDPGQLADDWTHFDGIFVAEVDEARLGYVSLLEGPAHATGWIRDLVVGQRFRRQGIATRFIAAAYRWCAKRGLDQIMIEMPSKDVPAVRLARKLNFAFAGYSDQYYADQEIALFFALNIR
jgi:GNAT superfamily N-acetyltransferase